MRVQSAIDLIGGLVYKPGWEFIATDHTKRFEDSVHVRVRYVALNSNRDQAILGYPTEITTYAEFAFPVGDCDEAAVLRHMLDCIIEIEIHEAREFLRLPGSYEAPFHPHRVDGMKRWGCQRGDVQFGLA